MSTTDNLDFPDLPPFPTDVPTAPLLRLSLKKLIDNDRDEIDRLWEACCKVGFFYLDLRDAVRDDQDADHVINGHTNGVSNGDVEGYANRHADGNANGLSGGKINGIKQSFIDGPAFLNQAKELFDLASQFYDLPVEEKVKYDFKDQGSYFGYKGLGAGIIDKQGTKDRNEFYNISKDDMLRISDPLPAPSLLEPYRPLLSSYITQSHAIITLLLDTLNTSLGLPSSTLSSLHDLQTPSGDQIRFVRSPPQPLSDRQTALGAHTDFGSVTLLFNRLGGLQILPPDTDGLSEDEKKDRWLWVRPLQGHCVVNLGDAMVKFTRGVLRSNIHRVVNPPGAQEDQTRFSLVYFSRPTDEVLLRPLDGSSIISERKVEGQEDDEVVSSKEWVLRRALGRRGVGDWEKTGGTESARRVIDRGMREVEVGGK